MLDLTSILFATTLVALSMGLMLSVFIRGFDPLMRGARPIAWACLMLACGSAASALRVLGPGWSSLAIVLGNFGALASQGLIHVGLCRLIDRRSRLPYIGAVLACSFIASVWYTFATPSLIGRVAVVSVGLLITVLLTLWELYCSLRRRRSLVTLGLIVTLGVLAATLALRVVSVWVFRDDFDRFYTDSPLQPLLLMVLMITLVLGILMSMMLLGERALERLRESARREDLLTGLPNRLAADEAIEAALERNAPEGRPTTVVRVDLDNFRQFNDWYGHDVGDAVLRHVTTCIRNVMPRGCLLARWSGKGYIVVMPDAGPEIGAGLARDIVLEISLSPLELGNLDIEIAACAGVACSVRSESTTDALMVSAEAALDHARRNPDGTAGVRELD